MTKFALPAFKTKALWQQAMTHSSYSNEHTNEQIETSHNERLEFLGDAILNFLSGEYLYTRYPDRPEGDLSQMREALVDESQLCRFAIELGIGQHIRLGKGALQNRGRNNARLLCSAFEALIGAYFLDSESDIALVRGYVWPLFDSAIATIAASNIKNEKSRLQEWSQQRFGEMPKYSTISSSGPDHNKEFLVAVSINNQAYAQGYGHSKKEAQKAAARAALEAIEKEHEEKHET